MSLIFHLLLCLSLNACSATARRLLVIDKETIAGLKLTHKNIETSIAERLKEALMAGIDRRIILAIWDGENKMQEKNSVALGKENEDDKGYSVLLPSPQKVLHETSEFQDRKRQARSIMEPLSDKAEETVDSKENDMGEDIVVMDYAQPHRKPPIHNREP